MLVPTIPSGDLAIRLIQQCVDANQPLLLSGPHGIGKTELFKAAAERLGIGYISRDLSLMEPTDLVGMPRGSCGGRPTACPRGRLPGRNTADRHQALLRFERFPALRVAPQGLLLLGVQG